MIEEESTDSFQISIRAKEGVTELSIMLTSDPVERGFHQWGFFNRGLADKIAKQLLWTDANKPKLEVNENQIVRKYRVAGSSEWKPV